MVRRYFRLRRLILSGLAFAALAAIAVPVAQAMHGESGYWTEQPVVAKVSAHGGVTPTMSQLEAEANAYKANVDKAEQASSSASGGFNWTDSGIGAAVVFGAFAILLAAVALARRYRSGPSPAGLAKA